MKLYGLLGHPLTHSFSRKLFLENFREHDLGYELFDHSDITEFLESLKTRHNLCGFNVTIPHKVTILKCLDMVSETAEHIGAVNTVLIKRDDQNTPYLEGYNTDFTGFDNSLSSVPLQQIKNAFILGTGGSAQAVKFALFKRSIPCRSVSRSASSNSFDVITYEQLHEEFGENDMLINCTPAGMHGVQSPSLIEPGFFKKSNVVYDLIYNPAETGLLRMARESGAWTKNGMEMLEIQAKESWKVWGLTN